MTTLAWDPTRYHPEGPPADARGGFYVTVKDHGRVCLALGPFDTHEQAKANVAQVRRHVRTTDPKGHWYDYGTSRVLEPPYPDGKLNAILPVLPPPPPEPEPEPEPPAPAPRPPVVEPERGGYLVGLDHRVMEPKGPPGGSFTLGQAFRELRDYAHCRIYRINPDGNLVTVWKRGWNNAGLLRCPDGEFRDRRAWRAWRWEQRHQIAA